MEIKRAVYQNQCFKSVSIKDFDSLYITRLNFEQTWVNEVENRSLRKYIALNTIK